MACLHQNSLRRSNVAYQLRGMSRGLKQANQTVTLDQTHLLNAEGREKVFHPQRAVAQGLITPAYKPEQPDAHS